VKRAGPTLHLRSILSRAAELAGPLPVSTITVSDLYAIHADFVWASLHRLGVRTADVPDMTQEVFLVVHRRLASWDQESRITTWLFGICLKVAAGYRRRAWFRREEPREAVEVAGPGTPEEDALKADARRRLAMVLDTLSPDRRAIFVMFELEEKSCAEIAELFDVPVGTVHSRLHAARSDFQKALHRLDARSRTRSP
jgi:RNA polymerase sigma-70 factor (ECF subfamily)